MSTPTVKFDNYDSSINFEMILFDYTIPPAVKKTNYISIPGKSGDLDLSDYLGEAYENRNIEIEFYKRINIDNLSDFQSDIEGKINGKKMKIVFSNDCDYYWQGRVNIDKITKISKKLIKIDIICNVYPFKINLTTNEEIL